MTNELIWKNRNEWEMSTEDGLFSVMQDDGGEVYLSMLGVRLGGTFGSMIEAKDYASGFKSKIKAHFTK